MNRTTGFSAGSWRAEIKANVIALTRTARDEGLSDIPWETANTYFIIRPH